MKNLYWYGARESDINDTGDLFEASITLFGESEKNISFCDESPIRINHNIINDEQDNFTIKQLLALYKRDKQAKIMFYNPKIFYNYKRLRSLRERIVCLNEEEILRKTDDKITFREMMGKDVSFLNSIVAEGKNCNIDMFREKFHGGDSFVIQCPISCGGNGTYVIRKYIPENIKEIINNQDRCLVTKFQEYSVPVNLHAIIYNRSIIFSPGSVQIVRETDSKLIYRGADFFTYKKLKLEQQTLFKEQSYKICERLQNMGYRGVLGIDGLITPDGQVYIMEINNRFQASTPLINKALKNEGRPSLHKMNLDAFMGKEPSEIELELEKVDIPYSCYIYVAGENDFHSYHVLDHCEKCVDEIVSDGFKNDQAREANAYLFKLIFKTNITSLSPNGHVLVYENIAGPSRRYYNKIMEKNPLALKIALLNQGIRIDEEAFKFIQESGGVRPATNSAIDIKFPDLNNLVINCPVSLKFTEMTPFSIGIKEAYGLSVFYYGAYLTTVELWNKDIFEDNITTRGIPYRIGASLSTDRLRLHHSTKCIFKRQNKSCKFCDICGTSEKLTISDIDEIVKFYVENINEKNNNQVGLRHFLVGGQSEEEKEEYKFIIDTIKTIRKYSQNDIYVMCLPPLNLKYIESVYEAGATEIAFNIEIFDSKIAREIMPGKGMLPRERYFSALEYATSVFGHSGQVRSLLVVGLEDDDIFYKGIEALARMGVQPILSIFRPLPDTDLYDLVPPTNEYLYELYSKAQNICLKYSLKLGPNCIYCQNNTLSLP